MSNLKRVMISLPNSLLEEVDYLVKQENGNRSQFIREAMRLYIKEKRRRELRERMKKGYLDMGTINLELANQGLAAENGVLNSYEDNLAECE